MNVSFDSVSEEETMIEGSCALLAATSSDESEQRESAIEVDKIGLYPSPLTSSASEAALTGLKTSSPAISIIAMPDIGRGDRGLDAMIC